MPRKGKRTVEMPVKNSPPKLDHTGLLGGLIDRRRRRILSILADRDGGVTERKLATRLAVAERGGAPESVSAEEIRRITVQLEHVHLPKLADVGLVRWEGTGESVTPTDHPAYDDPAFRRLVEREGDGWDETVEVLASECRRAVLELLDSGPDSPSRDDLARELAAREADGEPSVGAIKDVAAQLHHVHLPKLDRTGLIEYDADDGTVTTRDGSELSKLASIDLPSQ